MKQFIYTEDSEVTEGETYGSVHIHRVTDHTGDLVDLRLFCGDTCHRAWCAEQGQDYEGWDGCHEMVLPVQCECCGQWLRDTDWRSE